MTFTVKTLVQAPMNTVWSCWTEPAHIVHWNQASADWHTPRATNDLRPDGHFSYTMAARDGSMSFDFAGTYTEVVHAARIVYAMEDARKVEVIFEATDAGVEVTEIVEPETLNPVELQQSGWQAILDNFRQYTEQVAA
ncbi:MAG: SRPBCC domain-containing protein [Bacteroidia bacterium]|nr:SRPBCC domain-containing protein [Bacteroidia bacterium]